MLYGAGAASLLGAIRKELCSADRNMLNVTQQLTVDMPVVSNFLIISPMVGRKCRDL